VSLIVAVEKPSPRKCTIYGLIASDAAFDAALACPMSLRGCKDSLVERILKYTYSDVHDGVFPHSAALLMVTYNTIQEELQSAVEVSHKVTMRVQGWDPVM
jgi:hypothetical protein